MTPSLKIIYPGPYGFTSRSGYARIGDIADSKNVHKMEVEVVRIAHHQRATYLH